jgi:hypothetical protein
MCPRDSVHLLVRLQEFNTEQMNAAVFAFRRYEDVALHYTAAAATPGRRTAGCTTRWWRGRNQHPTRLRANHRLQRTVCYATRR